MENIRSKKTKIFISFELSDTQHRETNGKKGANKLLEMTSSFSFDKSSYNLTVI